MNKKAFQDVLNECWNRFKDKTAIEYGERVVTYAELDKRSGLIASRLRESGIEGGTFVGILMSDRVETITAIIGILKAACVFVPLDPAYPENRLIAMMKTVDVKVILTCSGVGFNGAIKDTTFLPMDEYMTASAPWLSGEKPGFKYTPDDRIYVYFTSGTTGTPKAIIGKNKSLLHFIKWEVETFQVGKGFRISQFTTPAFDAFLKDIFVPLFSGGVICIPQEPDSGTHDPELVSWIDKSKINLIHCVPSFFRMLSNSRLRASHFKHLKFLLLSGEKINPSDLKTWYDTFDERIQLVNLYGPTETTMIKTYYFIRKSDVCKKTIPIGKPMRGSRILILDENKKFCDELISGEIYIRTPFRTFGYYNKPELNSSAFIPNPLSDNPHDILYKTGDLGRFLPDGNIELAGRIDRQVKIRGIRVELGEIETALVEHPLVKEAVVIKRETPKRNEILIAYTSKNHNDKDEIKESTGQLREYLSSVLPAYMVPAHIITLEAIPRKPNRKVDYESLPDFLPHEENCRVLPRNRLERKLSGIWTGILGVENIGINFNFFRLGGNSLNAMSLVSRIRREFNIKISIRVAFTNNTIATQTAFIEQALAYRHESIERTEKKDYYTLSYAQKRLYFLQQMNLENTAYNMPGLFVLETDARIDRLEEAFKWLIKRHEILRTSFEIKNGEPVQELKDDVDFSINYYELPETENPGAEQEHAEVKKIVNRFLKPFDLSRPLLLRIGLIKITAQTHILMTDMHHIIADAVSQHILARDLALLYAREKLPPLKLQYKDFSQWQNNGKQKDALKKQEQYWLKALGGELPVLDISTDYARPPLQSFEGNRIYFEIEKEDTQRLDQVALARGATLYMVLIAVFNVFLSKICAQEDILIGTPTAGRGHADLEHIIGMFVNTLVLRNRPLSELTFEIFLDNVKENVLTVFENQEYPFEKLVEKLNVDRNLSRNPLFNVMFNFHNIEIQPGDEIEAPLPALPLRPYKHTFESTKFDLTLRTGKSNGKLNFSFQYRTKLFKKETIEKFVAYFKTIVSAILDAPQIRISEIEIISQQEKKEILDEFNQDLNILEQVPLQDILSAGFQKYSHKVAVEYGDQTITYSELHKRSNQIAGRLARNGIKKGSFIGVYMEDRLAIIPVIIGILTAGCVFVPLDTALPGKRIETMIQSVGVRFLFSCPRSHTQLIESCEILCKDVELVVVNASFYDKCSLKAPVKQNIIHDPEDNIYGYFTSGSTGTPNAVVGINKSLLHFIQWEIETFHVTEAARISQLTSPGFDAYLRDVFVPLAAGGTVCIPANREIIMNSNALIKWIDQGNVNIIHCVPSFFRIFNVDTLVKENFKHLKYILLAGEAPSPVELEKWYKIFAERIQIVNLYGPTETTLVKTCHFIQPTDIEKRRIPFGKPMKGVRIIILDKNMGICDHGIPGEIYIRTPYRTSGYHNAPELNRDRFIPNPFGNTPGDIVYRTGDLGMIKKDGEAILLGRIDQQMKIRGIRVEPEAIEKHLMRQEDIKEAVVTAAENESGQQILNAYIVSDKDEIPGLREKLSNELPAYMIPSYFKKIEKIPLNTSGKVDRKALAAMNAQLPSRSEYIRPANKVEERLAKIFCRLLNVREVGRNDDFFELGGNSMSMIKFAAEIHKEFEFKVPIIELLNRNTLKEISQYILSHNTKYYEYRQSDIQLLNKPAVKNIFCFPPTQGYGYFYKRLSFFFDDYSIYAFNFIEKENRLQLYVDLILATQAQGPYILLGYSAGGRLAFEVTKELEKKGHQVSDLIFIDSYKRLRISPRKGQELELSNKAMENMVTKEMERRGLEIFIESVIKKRKKFEEYLRNNVNTGVVDANIHLIMEEKKNMDSDTSLYWRESAGKTFFTYQGFGAHNDMLEQGYLGLNIGIIKGILEKNTKTSP